MKRFTDTEKWSDPWFRRLTSPAKQLWGYATDRCDKTGLVELDFELVTLDVGQRVGIEHLKELSSRVEDCGGGKFFIPKFIHFQYGVLTDSCPPHRPIIEMVTRLGLIREGLLYHYPNATLALGSKTRQDKTRQDKTSINDQSDSEAIEIALAKFVRTFNEIPTESEAIASTMSAGIPDDFSKYVYADWTSRAGKDAGGVLVGFLPYVCKRWAREQVEWKAKQHKGTKIHGTNSKPNPRNAGINLDSATQGRQTVEFLARKARDREAMQNQMATEVAQAGGGSHGPTIAG